MITCGEVLRPCADAQPLGMAFPTGILRLIHPYSSLFLLTLALSKAWKAGHPDYQIRLKLGGKELYTTEILAVAGGRLDKNSVLNSKVFRGLLYNDPETLCWHSPFAPCISMTCPKSHALLII